MNRKNTIPLKIHQIQEENNSSQLATFLSTLSQSWKKNHPLWQYKLWHLQDVRKLIQDKFPDFRKSGINNELLSNIARYFILYREGGLFVDSDFECFEPFDSIVKGKQCCFSYKPQISSKKLISNALIISKKEHSFLMFIIRKLHNNFHCLADEREAFLNITYSLYNDKNSIDILPASILNPCSAAELQLYQSGLISEDIMENMISEAISICHYMKESRLISPQKETDILYFNPVVEYGGAPKAAYRIHLGLRSIGVNSKMLVLGSNLNPSDNLRNEIHIITPEPNEIYGYPNDVKCLEKYPLRSQMPHSFSPAITGVNIDRYIDQFNPKIVQIHWVNAGFIKIEDLANIKKKIIWRLPDCWAFTGGCFYFGNCEKYLTGCGKCPKLGSTEENDLSREIWQRKEKAWKKMDMVIVVPTLWMKQVVESSTLLKGKDVFVIPNGLDLTKFYPINKKIARKALNIPVDKKVILFGATNAIHDPRKGFHLLLEALRLIQKNHKDNYYFVIFGSNSQELNVDIPVKFMGYVHEHHILQTLYSAADVMIVPSLEEAFGQTVTEAMACATPVISFQGTGPAGIIEHKKNGYLAKYGDAKDLSNAIKWIFNEEISLHTLSQNARYKIESTYDIRIVAKQYQTLYKQILPEHQQIFERI